MWRPDAKVCGQAVLRLQELAAPTMDGWLLVTTEKGYRCIHRNGLQTEWHDNADDAVLDAFTIKTQHAKDKGKHARKTIVCLGRDKVDDDKIGDTGKAEDTAEDA